LHDAPLQVHVHHAESGGLGQGHLDAGDRAARVHGDVIGDQLGVVHLVDVVAGQHQDVLRVVAGEDVHVLVDSIGRAAVPELLVHALLRRQQVDEFIELVAQERPAALQVAQQAVRLVLGQHADASDTGVQAVGKREVDDAELAPEVDCRLGAIVGQVCQARAAAAGQDQGDGSAGQLKWILYFHIRSLLAARVGSTRFMSSGATVRVRDGGELGSGRVGNVVPLETPFPAVD